MNRLFTTKPKGANSQRSHHQRLSTKRNGVAYNSRHFIWVIIFCLVSVGNGDNADDGIVEVNPEYSGIETNAEMPIIDDVNNDHNEFSHSDDDSGGSSDDEHDDDYEEDEDGIGLSSLKFTKAKINDALQLSKNHTHIMKVLREHRTQLTFTLAAFAFRREIGMALIPFISKHFGSFTLTNVIKIVLFVDAVRKMLPYIQQQQGDSVTNNSKENSLSENDDENTTNSRRSAFAFIRSFIRAISPVGSTLDDLFTMATYSSQVHNPPIKQHFMFECINTRYIKDGFALKKAVSVSKASIVSPFSSLRNNNINNAPTSHAMPRKQANSIINNPDTIENTSTTPSPQQQQIVNNITVILELKADTMVTQIDAFRDRVSFLISEHRRNNALLASIQQKEQQNCNNTNTTSQSVSTLPSLEILLLLESPGGAVHNYGLAASQVSRLRDEDGITLTICVDTVAASGGYMIACQSSPGRLFAAPFAAVGSIGVIAQTVNFHETLANYGAKSIVFKSSEAKAPVGSIGEVTKEGVAIFQKTVDDMHASFKQFVVESRGIRLLDIDKVSTGEVWLGKKALGLGLIDGITTSDDYIAKQILAGNTVLKLMDHETPRFGFFASGRKGLGFPLVKEFKKSYTKLCKMATIAADAVATTEAVLDNQLNSRSSTFARVENVKTMSFSS